MSKKDVLKTNFTVERKIESFYSGGRIAITKNADKVLAPSGSRINCVDLDTGRILCSYGDDDDENEITSFSLGPCDEILIVAYRNLLLKQWAFGDNASSSMTIRVWKSGHRGPIMCMAYSDDSTILATGSSDATVKVWDLRAQYCTHTLKNATGCISSVRFAPESWNTAGRLTFVFGDDMGKVFVCNLKSEKRLVAELANHSSVVTAFLFDDMHLYTSGRDAVIVVYNRHARFTLKKILPTFEPIESMCFVDLPSTDVGKATKNEDAFIATSGESGKVKVWSASTSNLMKSVDVSKKPIVQLINCDERRSLVVSTSDQLILSLNYLDLSIARQLVGRNDEIYDVAFVGAEDTRIVMATNSHELRIYDVNTLNCRLFNGHTDAVLSVDVAAWNRNFIASSSKDNKMFIWKLEEKEGKNEVRGMFVATGHTNSISCVKFSRMACSFVATVSDDHTLKVWKLNSKMVEAESENSPIALSAVSTVVAHEKDISAVDVAPNDRLLATCSMDKSIKLWNVSSKLAVTPMATIAGEHKRGVWDVKFSPVDQVLASCSGDFTVKIFALEGLNCLKTFEGHQSTVLRVAFVSNGLQLISSDTAGLIKLWTIRSNECVKTLDAHESKVYAMNVSASGELLVSGGADAQALIWRDVSSEERTVEDDKRKELVANEQKLVNLIDRKKYADALRLALTLNRPFNALNILKKLLAEEEAADAMQVLESIVKTLSTEEKNVLLTFVVEWNTNSRNCYVAQALLSTIFRIMTPEEILKLKNVKEIVEGLLPYSERHFERLSKVRQQACFVDFMWRNLRIAGGKSAVDGLLSSFKVEPEL